MSQPILLQPSFILHTRAYRDTSLLLEIFSLEHGRVSAVARGVKGPKSKLKGLLQPFMPLLLSWSGKTDLYALQAAETMGGSYDLRGEALLCGMYLNELIVKLLHRHDPHPQLFQTYQHTLKQLHEKNNQQIVLRQFEKKLLAELGYALDLTVESDHQTAIKAEKYYLFNPTLGFRLTPHTPEEMPSNHLFHGESLLALQQDDFQQVAFLQDAKRLLRLALAHLLEHKTIKSRELFFYQKERS